MKREEKGWTECITCGRALRAGQAYYTDVDGSERSRPQCTQCHEDYIRRAVRGSANGRGAWGLLEDEDRRHG